MRMGLLVGLIFLLTGLIGRLDSLF